MGERKKFFLRRPLFYLFAALLLPVFGICELLLADAGTEQATRYFYTDGAVYKEAWNKESDFVFEVCGEKERVRILIAGDGIRDTYRETLLQAGFAHLEIKASRPATAGNFGAFDYRKYLKTHKIDFVAYPDAGSITLLSAQESADRKKGVSHAASVIRADISQCLQQYLGGNFSGWVMSVMTGDAGALGGEEKNMLSLAGFSHLAAVSGAHIGFFTMPFDFVFKRMRVGTAKRKLLLMLPVLLLWFIAGGSPSVTRAVIMSAVSAAAAAVRKPYDGLNALGFAGILQLAANPYSIYSTGFLLSYAASFSILAILPALQKKLQYLQKKKRKKMNGFAGSLMTGFAVNLGMLPILLYLFNRFSLLGFFANFAASWAAGFLCVGGYTVYGLGKLYRFCESCLSLRSRLLSGVLFVVSKALSGTAAVFRGAVLKIAGNDSFLSAVKSVSPSFSFIAVYYLLLAAVLLEKKVRGKAVFAAAVILVFGFCTQAKIEFLFFDVGQGSAALVRTSDGITGLIDTGKGQTALSELLYKEGIGKLDFIVISHGHDDHYGGLEELLENIPVEQIFVPDNAYDSYCNALLVRPDITVIPVIEEAAYRLGKHSYMTMYESGQDRENLNDGSILVEIAGEWGNALFPGDAEAAVLQEMMARGKIRNSTILCLPHHGSDTSGNEKFLYSVMPEYVIISVGRNNSYGHPSPTVLKRLETVGVDPVRIYRTDEDGAVRIKAGYFAAGREFVSVWRKKASLLQRLRI